MKEANEQYERHTEAFDRCVCVRSLDDPTMSTRTGQYAGAF